MHFLTLVSIPQHIGLDCPFFMMSCVDCLGLSLSFRYFRQPSLYDPEEIVAQSGLDAPLLGAFLIEHYLHFFPEDHVEEAANAAEYLSDAGILFSCIRKGFSLC